MIVQDFNYTDSTVKEMKDFFETQVENFGPKEEKEKSSAAAKKTKEKRTHKKQKRSDSNSSVIESSEELSVEYKLTKKYCISHEKFSHSTD